MCHSAGSCCVQEEKQHASAVQDHQQALDGLAQQHQATVQDLQQRLEQAEAAQVIAASSESAREAADSAESEALQARVKHAEETSRRASKDAEELRTALAEVCERAAHMGQCANAMEASDSSLSQANALGLCEIDALLPKGLLASAASAGASSTRSQSTTFPALACAVQELCVPGCLYDTSKLGRTYLIIIMPQVCCCCHRCLLLSHLFASPRGRR